MGGTTAKGSLIEGGQLCTSEEYEVGADLSTSNALVNGGGFALRLPVIDISEVGAGGGSIVQLDKVGSIKVGPQSAGAMPGPVCYGRGGTEPTVTDANVILGYLNPVALAGGSVPINADAARNAIEEKIAKPVGREIVETAYGIHLLANVNMMRTVKAVTTNRGRDPRHFTLFAFGGSGGVHATSLARELRISRVVVPSAGGVFSALGLLFADQEVSESQSFLAPLAEMDADRAEVVFAGLADMVVRRMGMPLDKISLSRLADLRYAGQAFELTVPIPDGRLSGPDIDVIAERFNREHERRYGHCFDGRFPIEIVTLRLVGTVVPERAEMVTGMTSDSIQETYRQAYFGPDHGFLKTAVLGRGELTASPRRGPLVIEEYEGTAVVPPDASASIDSYGNIVIELQPLDTSETSQ
jgi:N-methylhydantoinase A